MLRPINPWVSDTSNYNQQRGHAHVDVVPDNVLRRDVDPLIRHHEGLH